MLKSKTSIFITIGVLLAIAIGLRFINNQEKEPPQSIKVIPLDAALILESNNFPELINKLSKSNKFTEEFSSIENWEGFFKQLTFLNTLFEQNSDVQKLFSSNRTICSGHFLGKDKMQLLYVLPLSSSRDEDVLRDFIARFTIDAESNERAKIMQRSYEGHYVYTMFYFDEKEKHLNFNYTFIDGLFIFSFSKILFEKSVRMLSSANSLLNDKGYKKVIQIAGKNVDANLYINYKFISDGLTKLIASSNTQFYDFATHFASWSVLDIKLKNDVLLMSGFTQSNDSLNNYLNVFKGQENIENDFLNILPDDIVGFIAVNLSDISSFQQKYVRYLKSNRKYLRKEKELNKLEKQFKYNFSDDFYEYLEGAVCVAYMPDKILSSMPVAVGILQINDTELLSDMLQNLSKIRMQNDSFASFEIIKPLTIDEKEEIVVDVFPAPNLLPLLFGKAFADVDAQYYIILDDFLILAKSVKDLKNYYQKYKQDLLINKNKKFTKFSNTLSSESNIFLYFNFFYGKSLIRPYLSKSFGSIYKKNTEVFDKLQAMALQFGVEKDVFFTGFSLMFNPGYNERPKNIWQIQMDAALNIKPQLVINHYTGNKEVLVQDADNNLILYATDGSMLWKRHLPQKILGKVHQIDFYKNNKLQLLFNTKNFIFLIDRKGRDVENYPIKFKSPATNGLAVFDYENKKNYRIFVACENKSVYLLNKYATKVNGWEFDKTVSTVSLPLKHFVHEGKDYIVFSDEQKIYILNRRGQTRVKLQAQFEKAKNSEIYFETGKEFGTATFITSGKNGVVYFIFEDGTIKKMTLGTFSPQHYFRYGSFSAKSKRYFAFTDGSNLSVFNSDKSLLFEKKFNYPINNTLNLYRIGKADLIGLSINDENTIYLYTPNGKIIKGFPMKGSGIFSIGKLITKSNGFNLITGSKDNILYNYTLK